MPEKSIVVSEAANACYSHIIAGIRQTDSRGKLEAEMLKTTAICIDTRSLAPIPCIVSEKREGAETEPINAEGLASFLMLYGKVIELEEKVERK